MSSGPLSTYDRQKIEAKGILRRIENHHFQQLKRQRSEGSLIFDDMKHELRNNFCRHQTQTIQTRIRRRQMTQQYQKYFTQNRQNRRSSSSRLRKKHLSERLTIVASRLSRKSTIKVDQNQLEKVFKEVVDELKPSQTSLESQHSQSIDPQQSQQNSQNIDQKLAQTLQNYNQNKTFLPMLELYIQQRLFLQQMPKKQQKIHSIIIQMMVLSVARRKNNNTLDALDLLVEINNFWPIGQRQMDHLKSVWYQLVAKMYIEVLESKPQSEKNKKAINHNRGRTFTGSFEGGKRKSTIIIRSLASKRSFMNRMSVQLRKMDLVHETSYQREQRDLSNAVEQAQSGKLVVSKITQKEFLSYPEPCVLYTEQTSTPTNYGVILIRRDQQTNLFPYHYPQGLGSFATQKSYSTFVSQINSYLVPQTKCQNYSTTLTTHFQSLFLIFLLIMLIVALVIVLRHQPVSQFTIFGTIFIGLLFVIGICLKIDCSGNSGSSAEVLNKVTNIVNRWAKQQQEYGVKCFLSQSIETIIITFPKEEQSQEEQSSVYQSRLGTFKRSNKDILQQFLARDNIKEESSQEEKISLQQELQEDDYVEEQKNEKNVSVVVHSQVNLPESKLQQVGRQNIDIPGILQPFVMDEDSQEGKRESQEQKME